MGKRGTSARPTRKLQAVVERLREFYGAPIRPPTGEGPFALILWEQVAYLADDARRTRAFGRLRDEVGLTPEAILTASASTLESITREGGSIAWQDRAERIRASARRVRDEFGGDLARVLDLPENEARRALTKFPMIGEPGAEKILLLAGRRPILALESNGLRVLLRAGYGSEGKDYRSTFRSVRAAAQEETVQDPDWMAAAHLLLRRHGQETCRSSAPRCSACPLPDLCAYALGARG